ncbi:MAG: proton-conducting transporter membrane subunit [Oscillospiraceae bacterium]
MQLISFLVLFPLLCAALLSISKSKALISFIVKVSSAIIVVCSLVFCAKNFFSEDGLSFLESSKQIDTIMLVCEILMMCLIVYFGFRYKKYYVAILSVAQTALIVWLEFSYKEEIEAGPHIFANKLSIIMCLIVAIVGCLICIYAIGYMKDYHNHHTEYKDRSPMFFAILFVFLGAMFGLIFSNNLLWLFFFWEITTLCSFLLIGYTKTEQAMDNSFTALWMNLLGGLAFAIGIAYFAIKLGTLDFNKILELGVSGVDVLVPVMLLSFAALTKSAQLPFSKWLLGAMVAPTPTSALLHSATMVKAGVYLLIRLSPLLQGNLAGFMVSMIGGFTFLVTSLIAISHSDAKKVLAFSTIANLGLICACAGVGIQEAVWAAVLLVIFHAVSKSLMFLSVGAVENATGSRSIEDMHGLIVKLPSLAMVMIIGIVGMFLAPFGMLISKWAALKAFIDSESLILILFLVFGSAATLFYWTKWLGKLVSYIHESQRLNDTTKNNQWFAMGSLSIIMVSLCLAFPAISKYFIIPLLMEMFGSETAKMIISDGNMSIMTFMLLMIVLMPICIKLFTFKSKEKLVISYMSGINAGNDREFIDSMGNKTPLYLSNWYMPKYFSDQVLLTPSIIIAASLIVIVMAVITGGALS